MSLTEPLPGHPARRARSRRAACLCLATAVTVLAGCGGERGGEPIPIDRDEPEHAAEPRGPLEASNVGPAIVSMTPHDVREVLGAPDSVQRDAAGSAALQYELPDGTLSVHFDRETGLMDGYVTDTRTLATRDGIRVGDAWPPIARTLSELLTDLDGDPAAAGDGSYLLSLERPGTVPALLFEVRDGRVARIAGGTDPPGSR